MRTKNENYFSAVTKLSLLKRKPQMSEKNFEKNLDRFGELFGDIVVRYYCMLRGHEPLFGRRIVFAGALRQSLND